MQFNGGVERFGNYKSLVNNNNVTSSGIFRAGGARLDGWHRHWQAELVDGAVWYAR
jgi:hypothetical protein